MNDPESPFLCETMAEVVRSKVKMSRDLLVILATSSIEMHETQKFAGFVANFWSTFALFYFFFFILFYLPVVFSFLFSLFSFLFFFFFLEAVSVSSSFRRSVRLAVTHEFFLNKIAPEHKTTVKPRYSVFQGTGQNHALYQGSFYCQHTNNYENTSWNQNLYALLAELC